MEELTLMIRVNWNAPLTTICLVGLAVLAAAPMAAQSISAQCSAVDSNLSLPISGSTVPAQTACNEIQGYLSNFATTQLAQWDGTKSSNVRFSTELLLSNCNLGPATLTSADHFQKVMLELNGLAAVGVTAITTCASFPLLYQPFYSDPNYSGSPQDFNAVVTFYQNLVKEAHRRGLKVIIEASVLFTGYSTQWNLPNYYSSFYASGGGGDSAITAGRQANALVIAQQIKPDYLNLGSEPDTQAGLLSRGGEYTAQEYATQISTIVAALRSAGITPQTGPLIGAGCGAWQQNGSDYVAALLGTDIDYYDTHIYSVNMGYLNNAVQYIDQAIAAGKGVAISEAWLHKMTDDQLQGKTELQVDGLLGNTAPLNPYTIWEPIDAEFIGQLVDLAYWKNLLYVSPFDSVLFFYNTYVVFNPTASSTQVSQQVNQAASLAFKQGGLSTTGQAFATAFTPVGFPVPASSATGLTAVATDSIVSIYGLNLAASPQGATTVPLPTTLNNVTVTATDNGGTMVSLPLFYVGPTQINAEIPSGLNTGLAALTITTPGGPVTTSAILSSVAPGLYSANESAKGVADAQVVINHTGVGQTTSNVFQCTASAGCTPTPIDLSEGSAALVLYGTGIRNRASLSDVTVNIGSLTLAPFFAGANVNYVGLDQVNVNLPSSLAGSGTVDVSVTVSGNQSNVVQVAFK